MSVYHLLDIVKFDHTAKDIVSYQQYNVFNNMAETRLNKVSEDFYNKFSKYELFHETQRRMKGRAYGNADSFSEFYKQDSHNCYLWKEQNIFIFEAGKEAVNGAVKRLRKDLGKENFDLSRKEVDFNRVLSKANNITGSWFGELAGNVTSVGIFGDHVNLSSEYDRFKIAGQLSALTIEVSFGGSMYSFMITKDRGLVIYNNMSIEKDLDLIVQIYHEFFKEV